MGEVGDIATWEMWQEYWRFWEWAPFFDTSIVFMWFSVWIIFALVNRTTAIVYFFIISIFVFGIPIWFVLNQAIRIRYIIDHVPCPGCSGG